MALVRDIIFKARPKVPQLIQQELSLLNLKSVSKLIIEFDPFRNDVGPIRELSTLMHTEKVRQSYPKFQIKTEVLQNNAEQTLTFELLDGKKFIFKCANLKTLEIFKLMNEYITPLAPKEEVVESVSLEKLKRKKQKKA